VGKSERKVKYMGLEAHIISTAIVGRLVKVKESEGCV
jgi:hypothetical protein